jgi:pimeloyl-ACP methyl ester carboxylesterase
MITRVFIHGLESTSQGTKGLFFRQKYPDMIIEDYTGPLEERMDQLNARLSGGTNLILVGSSYGGLMAALYTCRNTEHVRKLILLAPALHLKAFVNCHDLHLDVPVHLYHGSRDNVVPADEVRLIASKIFTHLDYQLVNDDHSLHRTFPWIPWDKLLEASQCHSV